MKKNRIFLDGAVITVDPQNTVAEAIVIEDNKILYVGSNEEAMKYINTETEVINLNGRSVVPGFIDAHNHLGLCGMNMLSVDCRSPKVKCIADIQNLIRERAKVTPKGEWIRGWGYNHTRLEEQRHPTRWELDEASPDHPVMISRICGHISVSNSIALEKGSITDETPSPEGGFIERENNRVNGVMKETAHNYMMKVALPTEDELSNGFAMVNDKLISEGITSIHEAGGYGYVQMKAMQTASKQGKVKLRVYAILFSFIENDKFVNDYTKCGLYTGFGDEKFRIGPIKLMIDGSSSGPTAATIKPYNSNPNDSGILCYSQEEVDNLLIPAHKAGYQITVHAVGDRAVTVMTNTIEKALTLYPRENSRHRIEHCALVNPELVAKIKKLGIVPIPQPAFLYEFGDGYVINYGEERVNQMFTCRSWKDNGIISAGSSDNPVTYSNPLIGMHLAVNRVTQSGAPISQDERISIQDALRMYTYNGAYASFEEDIKGSLEVGKLADLVVLSDSLYDVPKDKIKDVCVDMTIIDGETVYTRM